VHSVESTPNNAKEAQNKNTADCGVSTERTGLSKTAWNKETYSVHAILAILLIKNDRPQIGRFRDEAVNGLICKNFLA
jgi:hypothetical protein